MNVETAMRINGAAVHLWFYREGIIGCYDPHSVRLIHSVSCAQIQTASDVVTAMNEHAPSVGGVRKFYHVLHADGAPVIKAYADSMAASP